MEIIVRSECSDEYEQIRNCNDQAFGSSGESHLIDRLRCRPEFHKELSIIALSDGEVIGHILFFPIKISGETTDWVTLALAPMSVLPRFQRTGVGSRLVREGLQLAKEAGFDSVIVLGHKEYYPRFGFQRASQWNIRAPFDVPDDYFMAIELTVGALQGHSGVVWYPPEFDEVS